MLVESRLPGWTSSVPGHSNHRAYSFWRESHALQIEKLEHHYRRRIFILNHWTEMLCGLWWLEDTLCIINLMMNAFSNTPKWATSLQILDDLSPEKGQHGGDAGPAGSSTDQLPTPPRFSPATLLVPTLGALVIWPVLFHWGFKHPCVERKGHMFFRVEEIIDFRSCSYSFVQFLNRDYLYKHCLTGISSPRSRYSSGLPLGAVLPLGGGYLAISGCIFFVIAGEGYCYWHLIGEGHGCC